MALWRKMRGAMMKGKDGGDGGGGGEVQLLEEGDQALRYIRDRVNVPRDMSIWAGQRLRQALQTARQAPGAGAQTPEPPLLLHTGTKGSK
eukprot:SAG22_NODE_2993_length_2043_cov_5.008230_2_plen_90_part_00